MKELQGFWKGKFTLGSDPNVLIAPWARKMKHAPLFRGPHTGETQLVYKDNHFNITIMEDDEAFLPYGGKPIVFAGEVSITKSEVEMAIYFELESMEKEGIFEKRPAIYDPTHHELVYFGSRQRQKRMVPRAGFFGHELEMSPCEPATTRSSAVRSPWLIYRGSFGVRQSPIFLI